MKTILAIAANPDGTSRLRLDEEIREIRELLREKATYRGEFDLEQRLAARWEDVHRAILNIKPRIVHFCGHGTGEAGLLLERDCGQQFVMSTDVLSDLFKTQQVSNTVECVVLNACYSAAQAKTIAQHINYVIGMNRAIPDKDAIAYAKGFYLALGEGLSIPDAHEQALVSMKAEKSGNGLRRDAELPTETETDNALIPEIYIKEKLTSFPDPFGKLEGEKLKEGFNALSDLLSNPKVYEAVVVYRSDFKMVYNRVQLLSYYKQLHDLLQEVETQCYLPIFRFKQKFMADEEMLKMLRPYEENLQSNITKARNIAQKSPEEVDEEPDWIEDLENVRNRLEMGIDSLSKHDINQALHSLSHILATEPVRLNVALISMAKTLRLNELIKNLTIIKDKIIVGNLDQSESISKFEKGILSLSMIGDQLDDLAKEHDSWQRLNDNLRAFVNSLDSNMLPEEELSRLHDLQEKVGRLCKDRSGSEIIRVEKRQRSLKDALALNDPEKAKSEFYSYYAAALDVFVQVDLALLRLCEKLRQEIPIALAPVMEKLS